jgi:hypothetical protein
MLMLSDGEHLLFGEATKRHAVLKGNHAANCTLGEARVKVQCQGHL